MASQSFATQVTSATLASGDNAVVASATGQAIKVWQLIVTPGANADTVTLKFTLAGTASTVKVSVAANGASVVLPMAGAPWASCDPGTAFVANSGTTTTSISAYYTKGA